MILAYEVRDLQRSDACFSYDANKWQASSKPSTKPMFTLCGTVYLLGGYGILGDPVQTDQYFSRTYYNLVSHSMVYFSLTMYALDTWNGGQYAFAIQVDSTYFLGWKTWDFSSFPSNLCGGSNKDLGNIRIYGRVLHSTTTQITFRVVSKHDQDSTNESIGFRDLSMVFVTPSSPPSEMMCGIAAIPIEAPLDCLCPDNQYLISAGNCGTCHPYCQSCFGPGTNQCYACKNGYGFDGSNCIPCHAYCSSCYGPSNAQCGGCNSGYLLFNNNTCVRKVDCIYPLVSTGCDKFCESPCTTVGGWAYWDQSCLATCAAPPHQQVLFLGSTAGEICVNPCLGSNYLYWDGTCSAVCSVPPTTTSIFKAKNYCNYNCQPGEYLYWEGSCEILCVFPLSQNTISDNKFCYFPCKTVGDYLYWDGSCRSSCNPPLHPRTEKGKLFCDYPCLTGQFLMWYDACTSTCDPPLVTRIFGERNFCDHPCPGSQYLYWDDSCSTTCNPHLTPLTLAAKKFCNFPCGINQYLYWNGTCSDRCDMPLTRTFIGDKDFCEYPCNTGEFLYENGSCIDNCLLPFEHRVEASRDYCDALCPAKTVLYWTGECIKTCDFPLHFSTNSSGTYCADPCDNPDLFYNKETNECKSSCQTVSVVQDDLYLRCLPPDPVVEQVELVKLLHHIRYLDIKFPTKLRKMAAGTSMNLFTPRIISSMFDGARTWILEKIGASTFQGYDLYTSFLANFLDDLIIMGIIISAGILFFILERVSKALNWFYPQIVFERFSVLTKWNMFIILFTTNIGDIIFYSAIDFKNFQAASIQENISLIISAVMLTGILLLYIFNLYLLHKIREFKIKTFKVGDNTTLPDYYLKWQTCQVLFRGLKDTNVLTSGFYLMYSIRLTLPMLIALTLESSAIVQTSFYLILSCIMLLFLCILKPIKKTICNTNLIVIEAIVFIVNLSAFILTILDISGVDSDGGAQIFFTDVIITGNSYITYLPTLFLPIKIISGIRTALFMRRNHSSEELGAWIQLLFLPIQQAGLGFEQVELVTAFTISRIRSYNNNKKIRPSATIELDTTINSLHTQTYNNTHLTRGASFSSNNSIMDNSPQDFLKPPEESSNKIYKVSPYKKRKYNNNSARPVPSFETIEEHKEEDDLQALTGRYRGYSSNNLEELENSSRARKKDLTLPSQVFDMSGLDISQMTPFHIQNTPSS